MKGFRGPRKQQVGNLAGRWCYNSRARLHHLQNRLLARWIRDGLKHTRMNSQSGTGKLISTYNNLASLFLPLFSKPNGTEHPNLWHPNYELCGCTYLQREILKVVRAMALQNKDSLQTYPSLVVELNCASNNSKSFCKRFCFVALEGRVLCWS